MEGTKYKVRCLNATYDITNGSLLLNLYVYELESVRVITMHKDNFKLPDNHTDSLDNEMLKTATAFKDKIFYWVFADSPDKKNITDTDFNEHMNNFKEQIISAVEKIDPGSDEQQIQRKIGSLIEKSKLEDILSKEIEYQNKAKTIYDSTDN